MKILQLIIIIILILILIFTSSNRESAVSAVIAGIGASYAVYLITSPRYTSIDRLFGCADRGHPDINVLYIDDHQDHQDDPTIQKSGFNESIVPIIADASKADASKADASIADATIAGDSAYESAIRRVAQKNKTIPQMRRATLELIQKYAPPAEKYPWWDKS